MSKLPFVVEPRLAPIQELIGSEESGQFYIERRGYLSAGEKAFIGSSMASDPTMAGVFASVRMIAKAEKLDIKDCYALISGLVTGTSEDPRAEEIGEKYREEINSLTAALMAAEQRRQFIQAYCMLLYRVDATYTADDAMKEHPDIMDDLSKLFQDEEAKSTERLLEAVGEASIDEVDDIEKK